MSKGLASLAAAACLGIGGCANNALVAHNETRSAKVFGDLGFTGYNNTFTVEPGSRLRKLSIIGDGNHIAVEDDVRLRHIEIWGTGNTVSLPPGLVVRDTRVGKGNRIVTRATVGGAPGGLTAQTQFMTPPAESAAREDVITRPPEDRAGEPAASDAAP